MFELSGVNYEEVLEQGDSILVRVIVSSSYRGFELSGLYCNFDSTASFGSDQKLTLRNNIIDGGDVPFLGAIAAMEIYVGITSGVPGPIKEEVMKALCRDYKVDID